MKIKPVKAYAKEAFAWFINDLHLRYKLMFVFSFVLLIPILMLGWSSSRMMEDNLKSIEKKALTHNLNQANKTVDYFLSSYLNASAMLFRSNELQTTLRDDADGLIDAIDTRRKTSKIVFQVLNSLQLPEGTAANGNQGDAIVRFYVNNTVLGSFRGDINPIEDIQDAGWFPQVNRASSATVWQSRVFLLNDNYIVLNRDLVDFNNSTKMGVMRIFIPVGRLQSFLDSITSQSPYHYYYVDENYQNILDPGVNSPNDVLSIIQAHANGSEMGIIRANHTDYIVDSVSSNITGWKLIFIESTESMKSNTVGMSSITLLSILIALALSITLSIVFSGFITQRINVLVSKTNNIDREHFHIYQTLEGADEIGQLDLNFNRMVMRIERLIQNEYQSKITTNRVKLELLQEQINPHLLYNTLSTISMLAKADGNQHILDVTNHLISFYKGILSRGKIITSIREEVNMAMTYIEIMQFVYELKLDCTIEIDENICDCYSIKLILQPVIENAILHGLREQKGGQLFIGGCEKAGALEFVISDDGVGMAEDVKRYLNRVRDMDKLDKGYGLANVIKRIDLFWGREYGINFESTPGVGTTVTLRIPRLSEAEILQRIEGRYLA